MRIFNFWKNWGEPGRIGEIPVIETETKWKKIIGRIALGVGIIVIIGQFLSTEFRVIRVKTIKVKPAVVYPHVNELNNWEAWFPWSEIDKRLDFTLGDIKSGVGANLHWLGHDGEGKLVFTKSSPEKGIDFDISLYDGNLKCDVTIHFTELEEGTTHVSWSAKGKIKNPLIGGYLALWMEPKVGSILNRGLKDLRKAAIQGISEQNELEKLAEEAVKELEASEEKFIEESLKEAAEQLEEEPVP